MEMAGHGQPQARHLHSSSPHHLFPGRALACPWWGVMVPWGVSCPSKVQVRCPNGALQNSL